LLSLELFDLFLYLVNLLLIRDDLLTKRLEITLRQMSLVEQFQGFADQILALLVRFRGQIIANTMQVLNLGEARGFLRSFLYAMLYRLQKTHDTANLS
jgi:hypothetical protein